MAADNPCTRCGACCASFRVDFDREEWAPEGGAVPEGLAKGEPVLLEPVEHVVVTVPNTYTPAAQRLLTGRRGRILGYGEREGWLGWDDVAALVPAAELHDLIIELRSHTQGLGSYTHRFDHLAEAPARK